MGATTSRKAVDGGATLSGWHDPGSGAHLAPLVHIKLLVSSGDHDLHPHMQGEEVDFFARSMDHLQSKLRVATGHSKTPFHIVTRTEPQRRLCTIDHIMAYHAEHPDVRLAATPDEAATMHDVLVPGIEGGDKRSRVPGDPSAERKRHEAAEPTDEECNGERKGKDGEDGEDDTTWSLDDVFTFTEKLDRLDLQSLKSGQPESVILDDSYKKIAAMRLRPPYDDRDERFKAFCDLVEHVSQHVSARDHPYMLSIIAELWLLEPSNIFEHANLDILQHELRDFLTGRAHEWAPRRSWQKVQNAIISDDTQLEDAICCLDWVLPSEAIQLVSRAARFPDNHRFIKAISKLKGLGVSSKTLSTVLTLKPLPMHISTSAFVDAFFEAVPGGGKGESRMTLLRLSETEAYDLGGDAVFSAVRNNIFSGRFKNYSFKHLMDLVESAPRHGRTLWFTIFMTIIYWRGGEIAEVTSNLERMFKLLNFGDHIVFRREAINILKSFWQYIWMFPDLDLESKSALCVLLRSHDCMRKAEDFDGLEIVARPLVKKSIRWSSPSEVVGEACHDFDWEVNLAALHFANIVRLPESPETLRLLDLALSREPQFMLEMAIEANTSDHVGRLLSNATFRSAVASRSVCTTTILDRGMRRGKISAVSDMVGKLRTRSRVFLAYLRDEYVPSAEAVQAVIDVFRLVPSTPASLAKMMPAVELMRAFQQEGQAGLQRVWRERVLSEPALAKFMDNNVALVAPPDRPGAARVLIGREDTQASAGDLMVANEWELALDVIKAAKTKDCRTSIHQTLEHASDAVLSLLVKQPDHLHQVIKALRLEGFSNVEFFTRVAKIQMVEHSQIDPLISEFHKTKLPDSLEFPSLESLPDAPEGDHPIFLAIGDCSIFLQILGTCYFMAALASMFMSFNSAGTTRLWKKCFTIAFKTTKKGRVIPIPVDLRKEALHKLIGTRYGGMIFLFLCFVRASLYLQAEMIAAGDAVDRRPNERSVFIHFRNRLMQLTHAVEVLTLQNKSRKVPWASGLYAGLEGGIPEWLIIEFVERLGMVCRWKNIQVKPRVDVFKDVKPDANHTLVSESHAMSIHASSVGTRLPEWYLGDSRWALTRFCRVRDDDVLSRERKLRRFEYALEDKEEGEPKLVRASTVIPKWDGNSAAPFIQSILNTGTFPQATLEFLGDLQSIFRVTPSAIRLVIGNQERSVQRSVLETFAFATSQMLQDPKRSISIDLFTREGTYAPEFFGPVLVGLSKPGVASKAGITEGIVRSSFYNNKPFSLLRLNADGTYTEVEDVEEIAGDELRGATNPDGAIHVVFPS